MHKLNILKDYLALTISSTSDSHIWLKSEPNACFINNSFMEGLKVWKTNIDIQPVFIHPKAVTYTCACSIKAEDKTSKKTKKKQKKAAEKAFFSEKSIFEKMKVLQKSIEPIKKV